MSENKSEPVESSDQHNPSLLWIKVCLFALFFIGVLLRISDPFQNATHLADVLMWIAVLGRLFMYVRSLKPSLFLTKQDNSSLLHLIDKKEPVVSTYDQRTRTPLERVISDK